MPNNNEKIFLKGESLLLKKLTLSLVWLHPSIIPSFRRTTQEDYCESVISMGCMVRPCHKEKKGKKEGRGERKEGKREKNEREKERKLGS